MPWQRSQVFLHVLAVYYSIKGLPITFTVSGRAIETALQFTIELPNLYFASKKPLKCFYLIVLSINSEWSE